MKAICSILLGACVFAALAVQAATGGELVGATVLVVKGRVELSRAGATAWDPVQTNAVLQAGDRLRTGEHSRATLRLRDATVVPMDELTLLTVSAEEGRTVIELLRGVLSFFHRDQPGDVEVRGAGTSAIIRGTEFAVSVSPEGDLALVLFDGQVEMTNQFGRTLAQSGDLVRSSAATAPLRSPGLAGTNRAAIQWSLYYPSVLDPADVALPTTVAIRWEPVLALYRSGALWPALDAAKQLGEPASDPERLWQAALRLAVGDVTGFERIAVAIPDGTSEGRLRDALREVVRATQFQPCGQRWTEAAGGLETNRWLTTELLAASFCFQSQGRLDAALEVARQAAVQSPAFGFAQVRLAELEFGSGRVGAAQAALHRGLALSPRHASAVALDGFLLAARERFEAARQRFEEAIQLDPALGDAWVGRGLVRIRAGDRAGGRIDLETAAALEPVRSVLRSYLGKAFAEERNEVKAFEELDRARTLDALDPTPWLYSALLHYRRYEFAAAMAGLEQSIERNDNRAVYRSRLLLDQDAAVRSANLANIYELADMADVSRRESARAVMFDYANHSAHLNLASSYNALWDPAPSYDTVEFPDEIPADEKPILAMAQSHNALRDPGRFNLREETVWFNEHLLASLLAPTATAPLSQNLSQNEYSRLFTRNRVGLNSTTEYFSGGEIRQLASQVGNFDRFSYALDLDYGRNSGFHPNEDLSRIEWYTRAKVELTPQDSVLLLTKYQDYEFGDNFQHADPTQAGLNYRFTEEQVPIVLGGYHHEWSPGSHTLLLGGRLANSLELRDFRVNQLVAFANFAAFPAVAAMDLSYHNDFETYSVEANHIFQTEDHTTVFGGRFQTGDFHAQAELDATPSGFPEVFGTNVVTLGDGEFERRSVYVYHTWEIIRDLRLTGGLAYDDLTAPRNFRRPPLQSGEQESARWSPKAAVIWSPSAQVTVRGMYAESLGGVSYDESIRLEPTQLAGFPQAFRTLISESLVGSVEIPRHRAAGIGADFKFPSRTYVSAEARWLRSDVDQSLGYFNYDVFRPVPVAEPDSTSGILDYTERGVRLTVNQILAQEWFAQGYYGFTRAELHTTLPSLPAAAGFERTSSQRSDLHRLSGSLLYQRPDGWFGRTVVTWSHQENAGAVPVSGDDVVQVNLFIGYRFPRHLGDLTVGLLNVTDQNYALHPLTIFEETPRERTLYLRLRFNL